MKNDGVRSVGSSAGCLVGYDVDGVPVVWRPGEQPVPANPLDDYGGWYVERYGFDLHWIAPNGEAVMF